MKKTLKLMVILWLCIGAVACSKKGGSSAVPPAEESNGGYTWENGCCMKDGAQVDASNCTQNAVVCEGEHWGIVEDYNFWGQPTSSIYWVDCSVNYGGSGQNNCSGYWLVENSTNNPYTDLQNNDWKFCK